MKQRSNARIQGVAAGTGVVGGYLEKTYAVVAVGAVGAAAALEVGGYYWVTEEAMPFVSRMAVRGWQVGKPLAQAAFNRARQGFAVRALTDLGTQLGAGFAMNEGSIGERSEKALFGVNITSVFAAGVVNTSGLQMSTLAKWLVPASTAAVSNGLSGSGENRDKYGSYFHLVNLSNGQEATKYAFNIVLGTLLDRGRDGLVDKGAEKVAARIAHTSGRAEEVALRYVQLSKVALAPSLGLATGFESGKKRLEQWWDTHNEEVKTGEDTRLLKANRRKNSQTSHPAPLRMLMKWLKKYWGGLLLALFAIGSFWAIKKSDKMHQRAHYTIGYLTGWHPTPKSGIHYDYRFTVLGSTYEDTSPSDAGMSSKNGSRFVVKYDSIDPSSSVGYFNLTIPDSIREAPANGWRKPPFPIPQWILTMGPKEK